MKTHLLLLIGLLVLAAPVCAGQTAGAKPSPTPAATASPKPNPAMIKAKIQKALIANEIKLWEAWKNKDTKPFKALIPADGVQVTDSGVNNKAELVKVIGSSDCDVRSYSLSDYKLTMFGIGTAFLTYKATQDATCGGTTLPPAVWASSLWVLRGAKWVNATHQETPAK